MSPRPLAIIAAIAFLAAVGVSIGMRHGVGVFGDSVVYVSAAREFAANGRMWVTGISDPRPLTEFPPLYPILLSVGGDVLAAARVLNVLALAATLVFVGLIVHRSSRSPALAVASVAWTATSTLLTGVAMRAYSEATFTAFTLGAVWCYGRHAAATGRGRLGWLLACGLAFGLAASLRYAGLFYVFALLSWMGWRVYRRRSSPAEWLCAATASVALTVGWFIRNRAMHGQATSRRWEWHPVGWEKVREGLMTLGSVSEMGLPEGATVAAGAAFLIVVLVAASRNAGGGQMRRTILSR